MNRTDSEVIEDKNTHVLWGLLHKEYFWTEYVSRRRAPQFDFSDAYREVDIGIKAATTDDIHLLPVDAYISRRCLELIQERFWIRYMETL